MKLKLEVDFNGKIRPIEEMRNIKDVLEESFERLNGINSKIKINVNEETVLDIIKKYNKRGNEK